MTCSISHNLNQMVRKTVHEEKALPPTATGLKGKIQLEGGSEGFKKMRSQQSSEDGGLLGAHKFENRANSRWCKNKSKSIHEWFRANSRQCKNQSKSCVTKSPGNGRRYPRRDILEGGRRKWRCLLVGTRSQTFF